jgi:hypothetical protein
MSTVKLMSDFFTPPPHFRVLTLDEKLDAIEARMAEEARLHGDDGDDEGDDLMLRGGGGDGDDDEDMGGGGPEEVEPEPHEGAHATPQR